MLLHNLKTPHRIPVKLLNKMIFLYKRKIYDKKVFENKQDVIFQKLGLDRDNGLTKLETVKKNTHFFVEKCLQNMRLHFPLYLKI